MVMVVLFILNKWRYDLVAVSGLVLLVIFGIIQPNAALAGFSHPATITVALVLIISQALTKSGVTKWLMTLIKPFTYDTTIHVIVMSVIISLLSMFMNNVGALALMMPIAIESCSIVKRSPALLLMPLSFCSMLGGLVTQIGTPPNIIISHYRNQVVGSSFNMFDFAPVGGMLAIIGILFISALGWRLLKIRKKDTSGTDSLFEIESYFSELKLTAQSSLIGKSLSEVEAQNNDLDISIVSLISKRQRFYTIPARRTFIENDIFLVEGPSKDIDTFVTKNRLSIGDKENIHWDLLHSKDTDTIEVVIAPNSVLDGARIEQIRFKGKYDINLLGVYRQGKPFRGRIKTFKAQAGDVLLLHGETDQLQEVIATADCYPLAERGIQFGRKKYALHSLLLFLFAVFAATFNILPLHIAFTISILVMAIGGILPLKELYSGVEWPIIVLLAAMIPISQAMDSTGITSVIVNSLFNNVATVSPAILLGVLLVVTMTLSDILNNAATVLLMAPIARTIAFKAGYNPDPFFMAVAIGASCAFLSPIGHQNNTLIMGPGGYKFRDYWRIGLPLEILIVVSAVPLILRHWPINT